MTYTIDAKTPKGQANQMLKAINKIAKKYGLPATGFVLPYGDYEGSRCTPRGKKHASWCERRGYSCAKGAWAVVWEDGPYEWGVIGGNGGSIIAEELGYSLYNKWFEPSFDLADHVNQDHYRSFDFVFHS